MVGYLQHGCIKKEVQFTFTGGKACVTPNYRVGDEV